MPTLRDKIHRAYQARLALHQDSETNVYRLFHGYSEGAPGLQIDRYDHTLVVSSKGASPDLFAPAAACLQELEEFQCILGKERGQAPTALLGEIPSEPIAVLEHGLHYSVEAWAPLNPGLYLDARPARRWLRDESEGIRVLNLFSFAGSLGVAARAGGALSVTHVDTQKRALKRCQANHALNSQTLDPRDLVREDVIKHLRTAKTRSRRYGGVIVDPPPQKQGSRQASRLTPIGLAAMVSSVLDSEAWVLCFFHHDERSWDELEGQFCEAAQRALVPVWRSRSGADFPEDDERRTLRLSAFRTH